MPESKVVDCCPSPAYLRHRRRIALASLFLLHLTNPLTWSPGGPTLWFPSVGLALALIAWFGRAAAYWVVLDGLLVAAQALLFGQLGRNALSGAELALAACDAVLGPAFLLFGWWLYHVRAGGPRSLRDPRSAMRFLFLVPGLNIGLWALLHSLLFAVLTEQAVQSWQAELPAFWLSRSLAVLIETPLLLVVLTPWLARRGLVRPEAGANDSRETFDVVGNGERLSWGDGLELFGLAAGAGILTWLAIQNGRAQLVYWQLWGAPLLLIVWAGLRQGLPGSTLVAAASASLTLVLLHGEPLPAGFALLIQGNLLGQGAVALLVAVSAGWVRGSEDRYRQVTAHLPVVIYSGRFLHPDRPPLAAGQLDAEVTLVTAASQPILCCPPRQLLGEHQRWLNCVHPDDREVLRAALVQLGRQAQPVTCEYRLAPVQPAPPASPGLRWVRDTLAPHLDGEGRLIGWEGVLIDITPQRALADDLRRTTNMLHALVGNLPAGVFFVQGPRGHPILVNARARQLLGQREDTAASLEHLAEVYRLHRPDGTPYPVEELPVYLALRKGLTAMREDIVVHRPDGRRTPLVTWAAPVNLEDRGAWNEPRPRGSLEGGAEAAVWVMEDLTALHQAEAARRDTEVRLRAILETMAEGVVVRDHKGVVIDCNTVASVILGCPPEQLRGRGLTDCDWDLVHEDGTLFTADEHPVAEVLRMGRPVRNLVLALKPHEDEPSRRKEMRWLLANAMPLGAAPSGDKHGAAGVVSTFVDITASVRAQRMLRESEERHRNLVESLPLMVIQADENLRVTYANPAMQSVTGYQMQEIAEPVAWSSLIHADDLTHVMTMLREALAGRGGRLEFRYRARDGSEKVGLAFCEPLHRSDGTVAGTSTLIIDMTRQRELERELLRVQRLELVGRLSSGIAHDFNNLLSVVLSLTELVAVSLPAGHAAHDDLSRIRDATEQAASLAGQLLALSKQRRVALHRINVNPIVVRTLELLRASLPARIALRTELVEQELFIQADETQVQQVLMNLCLNARDAMPDGGLLEVRTARVTVDGDWARLSVCDHGTGIEDTAKAHLFDAFFSTKERGTGLGLAVVHQIVESHGGRVEVVSESGQGARFDVWWPASS